MADNSDDYLMLSGIQHFEFCKRQWALIHIEQQWQENVLTVEGQYLHRKADQPFVREKRGDKLVVRGMPVQSRELNISGICDVVEFIRDKDGVAIHGEDGLYRVFPVEYKRGKPKMNRADLMQLAAQAMCLEEMLLCQIQKGFMFYNETKHRMEVSLTKELKDEVRKTVGEMNAYFRRGHTPKVKTGPHCRGCSLNSICMPEILSKRTVKSYIEGKITE